MQYKKLALICGITIAIYLSFRFLLPLVIPFVVAGIVSILYYPVLRKMYKNSDIWEGRKKRWLLVSSVVVLYVLIGILLGSIVFYLYGQGRSIWLNLPFYKARAVCTLQSYCCQMDDIFHMDDGASFAYIKAVMKGKSVSQILPKMTTFSVHMVGRCFSIFFSVVVTVIATFFMIQDYERIRKMLVSSEWGRSVCHGIMTGKAAFCSYVKAQGVIFLIDGAVCTIAFVIIRQPYAFVFGPVAALVDALPVFGIGFVLFPCIIFYLLKKAFGKALLLLGAYIACVCIRQVTEPRLVGDRIGLRPLYTIASMYVGFQLFGVPGFVLGPFGVLVGKELYKGICKETFMG